MSQFLACIIFGAGVLVCFLVNGEDETPVSKAVWLPTVWLFFSSSRSLSQWLGIDQADIATVYLEGSPVDRNLLLALEVLALLVIIHRRRRVGLILSKNWAIWLFFLYAAISMAWSDFPFVTLKHWIKGIGDILMVLVIVTERSVVESVKIVFTRLAFILVPASLLFIWYYPAIGRSHSMDWTPEAVGVATQKNSLGELCDIYGLALLWQILRVYKQWRKPKGKWRLLTLGAILAMDGWLLHLCNSMTSICALGMASIVMLLSTRTPFRRRPASVHILCAGVICLTLYALFFQSSGTLVQSLGRNPTLTGRTEAWPRLASVVENQLIGVGYESFWLGERLQRVWDLLQGRINEAHNGYVELFLTLGWVGEGLFGLLIVTGYRSIIRAYRRNAEVNNVRIAWLLACLISGLTEAAFRMMGLTWIVFILATLDADWDPPRAKTGKLDGRKAQVLYSGEQPSLAEYARETTV